MSAEKHRYWPQALGTLILSGLVVWVTAGALLPERSELETRGGETAAQPEAESAVEAKPEQTA